MYFNRKNAEQKNWRMIKKGKHFLFGCSLVFAVGVALVAPSVKADTVATKPEAGSTTEATKSTTGGEDGTYAAPAAEVAPSTPVAPATVVAEEKAEKTVDTTQNSKEEPVVATEKAKEADSIQAPEVTVVYDPSALTDEEKAKVVAAVKAANPTATDVQVQADGSVVVTFADGSRANLSATQTIKDGSLVAKPRTNRAARATATRSTATRATEGSENLDYTNKEDVEGYVKISYEVDKANNVIHWTVLDNPGQKGNSASGYVYFTIPKDSVGAPTNWSVVQKDKNGKITDTRNYWKDNDGSYLMGQKGRMDTYTGTEMTKRLTELFKKTKNPAIKGNEVAVAAQTAERSQALYTLTADNNKIRNVMWTITFDTPILDKTKPLDFVAGMQGTGLIGGPTNIMTGFTDNFIEEIKFQAVAVKEKYTAKVGGSFDADPAKYVTNKAGTPEFPNNYRGATTFAWKDGQAPTATTPGTYTKTVVVTYPAHYKQAPQEVTITFEVKGNEASEIKEPAKTPVENPANLTQPEKDKVKKAIEDANPEKVANVEVTPDGTATVTFKDGSVATLTPDKTVVEAQSKGIQEPAKTPVQNLTNLTEEEKGKVKKAIEDANPEKVANVEVTPDGTATVTFKDGSVATLTPDKTVVEAQSKGIQEPAKTPVQNLTNLTEEEKGKVKKAIEDANPEKVANVEVTPDGTATVTFKDGSVATLTPDKTVVEAQSKGIQEPAKTPVQNLTNLTEEEKGKVKKAIEDANPGKVANVEVTPDGTATVTFNDGSVATLTPDKTVEKATKDADGIVNPAKTPVENPANLTEEEKGKVKKAIEDANPGKVANVEVTPDGTATVTFNDGSVATLTPDKTVEKATKDADGIVNPAKTPVENPANLTEEEKGKVKKAIEDANPGKVANVEVTPDGTATVTFNDGSVATLTPDKTVEKATKDADGIVNPAKTPVENPANLTEEEKGKVKKAIEDANPGKVANVEVTPDGTATVTFNDGSVATLTPDKTVEKATKDADGIVNPAKTPVENPANLTEEEKGKVKKAIEDANPGKVANVEVTPDGTATVTFNDGSVATLTPDKTVEKATKDADGIVNPAKTPVENPANLTEEEKGKVKKAIEDANPGKVANVEVTPDGTATVTFNDGSVATLTPDKTVEKATKDADGIVNPAKTPVENPANLTEEEKGKVKKAIEDANPGKVANVEVTPDGTATVTFNDGSVATLTPDKTVEKATKDADGIVNPAKTPVENPANLTEEEKGKVKKAIEDANPGKVANVEVTPDGTATVTFNDGSVATLTPDKTVEKATKDADGIVNPAKTPVENPANLTEEEKGKVKKAIEDANPGKVANVEVTPDGTATVTFNDGSVATLTPDKTVEKATKDADGIVNPAKTPVENPANLTEEEKGKVKKAIEDANPGKVANVEVTPDGTATVTFNDGSVATLTPDKTVEKATKDADGIVNPAKTPVENPANLTEEEKGKVKKAIEDANPGKVANVEVTPDGTATVTFNDGSVATLTPDKTVEKATKDADGIVNPAKTPVENPANLTEEEKGKVKKAIEDANPGKVANVEVTPDGTATVTFNDGSVATLTPDKTVEKATKDADGIVNPAKTPVENPANLTEEEKGKVKKAIEDANPGKVANVEVTPDGTATVTFNDGSVATLTPDKTVEKATKDADGIVNPAKTPVENPANLTEEEKGKVKKAIEDANPGKVANVEVTPDGTATVTFNDGSVATLTPDKTVEKATKDADGIVNPAKTPVENPANLTEEEKGKVKKAIEDANPGKVANVEVTPDGTATVTFNDGSVATLTPDKTVEKATKDADGIVNPAKTPVENPANLTEEEKGKVKKAIEDANPGKVANVEVTPDGTATVTFNDGSVATLTPDKTVEKATKDADGIVNPAKTPVENPANLTEEEKGKVKKAIEDANPGKVANVEVTPDGTATVTFNDGSVATLTPDKTVEKATKDADGIVNPAKTPVENPANLTEEEKGKVKKAIEDANPGKVANVEVTPDGTATVTFNDGSVATLTPDKTVEKATKDADGIVNPAKTPVENPANLTEEEKGKVKKAIEDANPGKVANVEVTPDGTATVTFNDGSVATLTPDKTVEKATKDADGIVNPAKTPVENPANLTEEEKGKVKKAIEDANPGKVANVEVTPDGTATVTFNDGSVATLTPDKTVEKATKDADGIVNPAKTPVENPANLTEEEKGKVKKAIEDANPGKVANVEVTPDGTATVTFNDGSVATLTPDKTVEKATKDADGIVNPAKTPVENPANLTEEEKGKVKKAIEDANPGKVANVEVTPDGTATVTFNDGSVATLTPDKTVEKATKDADGIVNPAKTPVENPANLTEEEKGKVKKAIEDANPGKVANVEVTPDGTATVTFNDGSVATLTPDKTVEKATKDADGIKEPAKTPVGNPFKLTEAEKAKVIEEVKKANPKAKDVEVSDNGATTVTFNDGSVGKLTQEQTIKEPDARNIQNPTKTPVENPANLTEEEKGKVKKAIEDANPGKVANVEVTPDGTATVTFNDGSVATLTPDKTVEKATKDADGIVNPAKTPVENPANLTEEEKGKVKKAIEDANPGKVANVEVTPDGTATVTFNDGSVATLTPDKTVEKATKDADGIKEPAKTPVGNPFKLTEAEKAKVIEEVKKANPKAKDVEVSDNGATTVTFNDGSVGKLTQEQTIKEPDARNIQNPTKTPVENPANLTEEEKGKVKKAIEDANPGKVANVVVGNDGSATVTFKDGSEATLTPDKTVKKSADKVKESDGVKNPTVTPVTDPSNLTDAEKAKVADEVKKANPTAKDIKVNNDGSVVVTFKDGTTAVIPADKTVKKSDDKVKESDGVKNPTVTPVTDPSNLTDVEKAKVADEVKKANPTAKDIKVNNDGSVVVTFADGTTAVIPADKTVKKSSDKAKESDGVKNPSVTPVKDPSNLTDAEKAKVAEEVKKSNPTATDIKVNNDGSVVVTFADGSVAVLASENVVKEATKESPAQEPAKKAGAKELPNTGTKQSSASLALALLAAATGGLLIAKKREEEE